MSAPARYLIGVRPLPPEIELNVGLDEADDDEALRHRVAKMLRRKTDELPPLRLRKRSIDARRGQVSFHLLLGLGGEIEPLGGEPPRTVETGPRAIIVGDGPCGLFCAYQLARSGLASVVVDRGKTVQPRRHDLKSLQRRGVVDPDSNYCFGEGGAGTYSDGKLYTRSHKRGPIRDVLELLVTHGAPESILVDARPHIGSNKLPKVVTALREHLEQCGVEFHFGARVVDLLIRDGAARGVRLADGSDLLGDAVVLATGHSASDINEMLAERGVDLEPKAFALGVRIEHPQSLINRIQYGRSAEHPKLPNAAYRVAQTVDERGVFSFCMCPGGWIVPASTDPGHLVVNGMSLSRRDSPYANSGLVVAVEVEDWRAAGFRGVLGGVQLQRHLERSGFVAGGGDLVAPATRASDFVAGRASSSVPESSYIPGLRATDLGGVLDSGGLSIASRIRRALAAFEKKMAGYASDDAVLIGVESRTSSPVRVPRHPDSLESLSVGRLYPAGEGAGYAGGIVSAALDGMNVAHALTRLLAPGAARTRRASPP